MVKYLLVLAILAYIFVLTTGNGTNTPRNGVKHHRRRRVFHCNKNEEWSTCTAAVCRPKTCKEVGFPVPCMDLPQNGTCPSGPGCICKENFVKDHRNVCIPIGLCPSCGGDDNAYPGCGNCNPLCSNYDRDDVVCTEECRSNACNCKKGYVLDESCGKCVKPSQCPPRKKCKKNEVLDWCPSSCPPRRCGINDAAVLCAVPLPLGHPDCPEPKCRCKDGYYRNHLGDCVLWENCPKCPKPYQEFDPCLSCPPRRCDVDERLIRCAAPLAVGDPRCESGCRCIDGYKMNSKGDCIPADLCPPKCGINEVFSDCIPNDCKPQTCLQIGTKMDCPILPAVCRQGCICKDGHVRNEHGVCIPIDKCSSCGNDDHKRPGCGVYCNQRCSDIGKEPGACILVCYENSCDCEKGYFLDDITGLCVPPEKCPPQCAENEFFSTCTQGHCSPQNCTQVGFPQACPRIIEKYCKKGCLCKEGFARNAKGICIPINKCPRKCPANEFWSDCANGGCQARNCSQYGKPVPCVKMDPKYCEPGCVCEENFLRAYNGRCVPAKSCPEACNGPNEEFKPCSRNCPPRTCESLGKAYACPIQTTDNCQPICQCKQGFYRNKYGQCVTEQQCYPTPICGKDEVFEDCKNPVCKAKYCTELGFPINCKTVCKKECVCRDGYVRDNRGKCIPQKYCPSCGGDRNATVGCGNNCGRHCSNIGQGPVACIALCKINSCDCKEGFFFNDIIQKCVKSEDCPKRCPAFERYEKCPGTTCEPEYCSQLGFPYPCPDQTGNVTCSRKPRCVCIDGYVRDANGRCIPKKDCPSCGGDIYARPSECGGNCGKTCRELGKGPRPCPKICYRNACTCLDGYYYDANRKRCVLPGQCTDLCDENEIFENCSNPTCKAETCSELGFPLNCTKPCKKGCICQNGYVRDASGKCVPADQCQSCGGDDKARLGCGNNCNKRCPNNQINPKLCPRIACIPELNKCECIDGYFFDAIRKKCVKLEDCTPRCNANNNEEPDSCVNGGCGWKNCTQVGGPILCIDPIKCIQGCSCKKGYYRLDNGTCVPENQCPNKKCKGPNEHHACGSACDNVCSRPQDKYDCPIKNIKCVERCYCNDGFARNEHGICIPQINCPPICKGPNEHFECGPACDNVCGKKETKNNCPILNIKCNPKCYCNDGFARNKHGICIPRDECPKKCEGPNEHFECGPACDNVCGKKESKNNCPILNIKCNPKCYCNDGFARNKYGICIPRALCPKKCKGPNEHFECGPDCDNVCGKKENKNNCPRINKKCNPKCYCNDGFARNIHGICIPVNQCPPSPIRCPVYERYEKCPGTTCEPEFCSQLGFPYPCPEQTGNVTCSRKPRCVCIDGYVRDANGRCIPKKDCPSCGGDIYARPSECGGNCGKTCRELGKGPRPCLKICYRNACTCLDGYYYDANKKQCVPPGQCTDLCDKNEIFENCTKPTCKAETCTELLEFPLNCNKPCKKGCICQKGYVRDANGKCIPADQCPPRCNVKNNEVPDSCVNGGCGWKNCSQVGGPILCIDPIKCMQGCSCKKGYYRLDDGTCVPENQCPNKKCKGPNEHFEQCGPKCDNECGKKDYKYNCPYNDKKCYSKCYCNDGFARNEHGICIPVNKCPKPCGPNEFFDCGPPCDNVCGETESRLNCHTLNIQCNSKCYCKDGFARNKQGMCIPKDQCPCE